MKFPCGIIFCVQEKDWIDNDLIDWITPYWCSIKIAQHTCLEQFLQALNWKSEKTFMRDELQSCSQSRRMYFFITAARCVKKPFIQEHFLKNVYMEGMASACLWNRADRQGKWSGVLSFVNGFLPPGRWFQIIWSSKVFLIVIKSFFLNLMLLTAVKIWYIRSSAEAISLLHTCVNMVINFKKA